MTRAESMGESVSLALFALGPVRAPLELSVMIGGVPHLPARRGDRLGRFAEALLRRLRGNVHRVRGGTSLLTRNFTCRELGPERVELGAPPQWAGATSLAREPDSATWIDECTASGERADAAEQRGHPVASGWRRIDGVRQGVVTITLGDGRRVQRQQEERTRVRLAVPFADRLGDAGVAYEHRMHRGPEISLDEQRRRLVGCYEVAQRAENRALTKPLALLEEPRRRRRKSDAFALEPFQCVHLALQRNVRLVGAEQLGPRDAPALTR